MGSANSVKWVLYQLITPKSVQKKIDALPDSVRDRIDAVIRMLADNPRPDGVVKIKGSDSEYRIRIGDYRVVYEVNDDQLIIFLIQFMHRREIYKSDNYFENVYRRVMVMTNSILTPASANIFEDLGFSPEESEISSFAQI